MDIHAIDLHYHAGQERGTETSLEDCLHHARSSGRKVLGLTDHLGLYAPPAGPEMAARPYPRSSEGLRRYRDEVEGMKPLFSDMELFFAPEIGPGQALDSLPGAAEETADFFICEVSFDGEGTIEANTGTMVARIGEIAALARSCGKPAFLAHPFRASINRRLIKYDLEPWVTGLRPGHGGVFTRAQVNRFLLLDIAALGAAAAGSRVPLEINGNTHYRARSSNLPAVMKLLWQVYRELRGMGVEFVPGSDQHGFRQKIGRVGGAVPEDCFDMLGLSADDITFLERIPGREARATGNVHSRS